MLPENPTDEQILEGHRNGIPGPSGEAPPASETPAATSFNPADWAYKFRDTAVQPKSRDEVIELMQLGHSYRVNKPTWERERESLKQYEARKDVYQRYDALAQAMEANPQFRSELQTLAQKYSGQPQPNQSEKPEVDPQVQELLTWKEQQEQKAADDELTRELDSLEKSFPGYDWKTDSGEGKLRDRLIRFMSEEGIFKADRALKAMMYDEDVKKAGFTASQKTTEDLAKQKKLGVTVPGTQVAPSPTPASIDFRGKNYDELEALALESLGRR